MATTFTTPPGSEFTYGIATPSGPGTRPSHLGNANWKPPPGCINATTTMDRTRRGLRDSQAQDLAATALRRWRFPFSRRFLWDRSPAGATVSLTAKDFLPTTEIVHGAFLAASQVLSKDNNNKGGIKLSGKWAGCDDGKVTLRLERMDQLLQMGAKDNGRSHTLVNCLNLVETRAFQNQTIRILSDRFQTSMDQCKDIPNVSSLFPLRCTCKSDGAEKGGMSFSGSLLCPSSLVTVTPLYGKRVCDIPLAKSLEDSMSASRGPPQMGFVSMDQGRSLVPMLPADALANGMPVVGLWVGGVKSVVHSALLSGCLMMHNTKMLKDKAFEADGSFLLLFYGQGCTTHKCFECRVEGGDHHGSFSMYKFSTSWQPHQEPKQPTRIQWEMDIKHVLMESKEAFEEFPEQCDVEDNFPETRVSVTSVAPAVRASSIPAAPVLRPCQEGDKKQGNPWTQPSLLSAARFEPVVRHSFTGTNFHRSTTKDDSCKTENNAGVSCSPPRCANPPPRCLETISEEAVGPPQGSSPLRSSRPQGRSGFRSPSAPALKTPSLNDSQTAPPWNIGLGSAVASDREDLHDGGEGEPGKEASPLRRDQIEHDFKPPTRPMWSYQPAPVPSQFPPTVHSCSQDGNSQPVTSLFTFNPDCRSSVRTPNLNSDILQRSHLGPKSVRSSWSPSGPTSNIGSSRSFMGLGYGNPGLSWNNTHGFPAYSGQQTWGQMGVNVAHNGRTESMQNPTVHDCNREPNSQDPYSHHGQELMGYPPEWKGTNLPLRGAADQEHPSVHIGTPSGQNESANQNISPNHRKPLGAPADCCRENNREVKELSDDPKILKQEVLELRGKVATLEMQVQKLMVLHNTQKSENQSQKQQTPVHASEFTVSVNITGVEDTNVKRVPYDTPIGSVDSQSAPQVNFNPDVRSQCHNLEARSCMPVRDEATPLCNVKGNSTSMDSPVNPTMGCAETPFIKKGKGYSPQPGPKLAEKTNCADGSNKTAIIPVNNDKMLGADLELESLPRDEILCEYGDGYQEQSRLLLEGSGLSSVLALPDVPNSTQDLSVFLGSDNESSSDDLDWIERKYGSQKIGTGPQSYLPDLSFSSMQYLEKLGVLKPNPPDNTRESSGSKFQSQYETQSELAAPNLMPTLDQCCGNGEDMQRLADGGEERDRHPSDVTIQDFDLDGDSDVEVVGAGPFMECQ